VAPVFNEREGVVVFVGEVRETLECLKDVGTAQLMLVNDGSTDGSDEVLDELAATYPDEVAVLHLSRNFGHAAAVSAGLEHCAADIVVLMDADLQDDPGAIAAMLEQWRQGYDVVYAVRSTRDAAFSSRIVFAAFYRLLGWMAAIRMPNDAGNFGLMDRRVVDALLALPERNRYLPGLRAWLGFRQTGVAVPRRKRYDGRSRVGLRGLWKLAMNAIFSFSYVPLFAFRFLGLATLGLSLFLILFALYHKLVSGLAIPAWTSQLLAISFFGGINLLGIGIVGEYVARIYDEVKRRPAYLIDRVTGYLSRAEKQS
jgi:dolichol-phosphate mannosyltransferase